MYVLEMKLCTCYFEEDVFNFKEVIYNFHNEEKGVNKLFCDCQEILS